MSWDHKEEQEFASGEEKVAMWEKSGGKVRGVPMFTRPTCPGLGSVRDPIRGDARPVGTLGWREPERTEPVLGPEG